MPTQIRTDQLLNPFKFNVYRAAAYTTVSNALTKMPVDTKDYDTSTNFDVVTNFRFTVPFTGFYRFSGRYSTATTRALITLYKNGAEVRRGQDTSVASGNIGAQVNADISLVAGDYIELWYLTAAAVTLDVGLPQAYFSGHLISIS